MTPAYEPRPDTIAFRALAHMALLHKGSEISNSLLATALGCNPSELPASLKTACSTGAIFARQKGGHSKSPLFWSLADHSAKTNGSSLPPAVVSQLSRPVREAIAGGVSVDEALSDDAPTTTAVHLQRIVDAMPRTGRSRQQGSGVDIDESHRTRDNVIEMDTPEGRDSQHVLKAERTALQRPADATDRETPANASPRVGAMGTGQAADAAAQGEPFLVGGFGPALKPVAPRVAGITLTVEVANLHQAERVMQLVREMAQ